MGTDREGDIMQLTNTTDYAIRIVCYLASENKVITTAELSRELNIPASYIPKITKQLKEKEIVKAAEGSNGGYMLEKRPGEISLMDVINCTESTMAISRCLEKDGYCSRNYSDCCKVHKVLLDLQNTYNNSLENVKISDIIQPGKDEYFGRFYVVIKLNLKDQTYECIYSHVHEVYDKVSASASYGEFVKKYTEQYVHEQDRQKLQEFLASEKLTEHLVDGCMEEDMRDSIDLTDLDIRMD